MHKPYDSYATGVGKNFDIWQCPENREQTKPAGTVASLSENSYQPNGWDATSGYYLSTKIVRFKSPSTLAAMFDGIYYRADPWFNDGIGSIPAYTIGMRYANYTHNKGLNMLFADGHATYLKAPLISTETGGNCEFRASY
jgi:prepilin-type processing-associated H-X9-DG protein